MIKSTCKVIPICSLLLISTSIFAEGIIDIKPYISTSLNYDDNLFRFSSPEQAKASIGSSDASDVVKQVDVGVNVNLRLSRQLVTFSTSVNDSSYNRFKNLDNSGKSGSLRWSWHLGSDLYGELSASKNEAIAGFNETRSPLKNLRTTTRQLASINWRFHPDWTLYASREQDRLENALISSNALDREDDIFESGVRYQSQRDTQFALAYHVADSTFPNRAGFTQSLFGNASTQTDIIVTATWLPTVKTKISTRISQVSLNRPNSPQRDFNGFSQRWNLDYLLTGKTNVNLTAYQEVSAIDDVLSTYVKTKGYSVNPTWSATSKIFMHASLGYEERTYLGSAGILSNESDRSDESKLASLAISYAPTLRTLAQFQYQGERRTSNTGNAGYQFNNINLTLRYDY